jgi:hypothetical protein
MISNSTKFLNSFSSTFNKKWLDTNLLKFINHPDNKNKNKVSFKVTDSYYDEETQYETIDYSFYDFLVGEIRTFSLDLYIDNEIPSFHPDEGISEDDLPPPPEYVLKYIDRYRPHKTSFTLWKNEFVSIIKDDLKNLDNPVKLAFLKNLYSLIDGELERTLEIPKKFLINLKDDLIHYHFYQETILLELNEHAHTSSVNTNVTDATFLTEEEAFTRIVNLPIFDGKRTLVLFLNSHNINDAVAWLQDLIRDPVKIKLKKIYVEDEEKCPIYKLVNTLKLKYNLKHDHFFNHKFLICDDSKEPLKTGNFNTWKSKRNKFNKDVEFLQISSILRCIEI